KLLLAAAYFWPVVLLARFIDRFGKGIRVAARDALIAEATPANNRGAVFGFHRAMDTVGAIGGPLIAVGLIAFFHADYRPIFLISFIPALAGVLILQFFVSEGKAAPARGKIEFRRDDFGRQYYLFLFVSLIFSLGNSSDAFLILRSKDLGLPVLVVIFAYIIYNIFYAAFSYPAGLLADKIGFKKVLLGGFFVFTLVYYGFGAVNNPHAVWLLFAVYGFYIAFTEGVSKAYISNLVPAEKTGTAIGLYYTVTGAAILFASLAAGWLWTVFGPRAPFYYGSCMAGIASVLFVIFLIWKEEKA
ncbi:MFS transporter, partial [Candidatus Saganbacteria bacterium]|nr:MFS transporter [Candidatus Saganbacteria bacterium]